MRIRRRRARLFSRQSSTYGTAVIHVCHRSTWYRWRKVVRNGDSLLRIINEGVLCLTSNLNIKRKQIQECPTWTTPHTSYHVRWKNILKHEDNLLKHEKNSCAVEFSLTDSQFPPPFPGYSLKFGWCCAARILRRTSPGALRLPPTCFPRCTSPV